MGHCSCFYGHDMWNGDGKPEVWAFRLAYFEEFQRSHPEVVLGTEEYYAIYDCFESYSQENLDCWYCDECGGLVVFVGDARFGLSYAPIAFDELITETQLSDWELYFAMRDREFEWFSDYCEGKRPLDALLGYRIPYRCRVSPDLARIFVFNEAGKLIHLLELRMKY